MNEPTIDRDVVRPILNGVRDIGGDVEALLEDSGLLNARLNPASVAIPEAPWWGFLERGAPTLDLPTIGLRTGAALRIRDLGPFGKQLEQSVRLYRCLEEYIRCVSSYSSHAISWLDETRDGYWFCVKELN